MNARHRWPFWTAWHDRRADAQELVRLQKTRLQVLVERARAGSPFYAGHYRGVPAEVADIRRLPPVTKKMLLADFDRWPTDRRVTAAALAAFLRQEEQLGVLFQDRYVVWTSSGTTGAPAIFLQESGAMSLYNDLMLMRGWTTWFGRQDLPQLARRGFREAGITATGGHFASVVMLEYWRRRVRWAQRRVRVLSVLWPMPRLVTALNEFSPVVLFGYPSVMEVLADERREGRLSIKPLAITTSGEVLAPPVRETVAAAFGCPVYDIYGTSEFPFIGFGCAEGWIHVNADWTVLEAVDAEYRPVPAGELSHTVLLTNLANTVQPIIRYDLGDSIQWKPDRCPCGNPLPALRVEGRRDDVLIVPAAAGGTVRLLPMALATVVETTPGVGRYQIVQVASTVLAVRLEVEPGLEREREGEVWERVAARLREFLAEQGAPDVTVMQAAEPPRRHPGSGKLRQVIAL